MQHDNGKKVIVLIEDEEVTVNLLTNKFKMAGYEVKAALDGVAGLDLIRAVKPDLVLLDMMLPRLNGFGVLEKLAEEKILPDLPIIIISNSGQPVEIDRALKLGVRDYLIKVNFDPNEVVTKAKLLLGSEEQKCYASKKNKRNVLMRVLLVEDDVFLADLLERKFTQSHIKIFLATDADQARSVLSSNQVDAILLDIILPGSDGITLLKELKANEKTKNIPVIILSNLGQQEEMRRGLEAGAAYYIIKAHSTPNEIVAKVEELINK